MANSRRPGVCRACIGTAVGLCLLLFAAATHAGPGFISESRVDEGDLYTEISVRFHCNVHYLGHEPAGRGDVLRIRIETTTVCRGSPDLANRRELHRPLDADAALLDSIEYDGETVGGRSLRFDFDEVVTYQVSAGAGNDSVTVRVFAKTSNATRSSTDTGQGARRVAPARPGV